MFYKRILALLLCLSLAGQIWAQKTTDEPKKLEIPAELKEKSLLLLNTLARESEQFFLAENRVKARILIADLMWDHDEKQARAIFQAAVTDLNVMIGQIPPENEENVETRYMEINPIKELRAELLVILAGRDAKLALDAMQIMNGKTAEGENLFTDDQTLELSIASELAEKDPKQAYELAKKNLENNIDSTLFTTLEDIYKKDADLGAKLAKDILGKIKSRKINTPYEYSGNTNAVANRSNTSSPGDAPPIGLWQVQSFVETVKKLNRLGAKDNKTQAISESELKELIELLAQKYLNQPYLTVYDVSKIMADVNKYFPSLAQALRRKLSANNSGNELDNQIRSQSIQEEIEGKTAEEILQLAEKKPVADRDEFYRQAAEKALEDGNVTRAREMYSKVKKKPEYDYFGDRLESDLPLALAKSGDLRATREVLSKMKTSEERIEILTNLAVGIAAKGDRKTAATLIEEARSMFSGRIKQRKNLTSILQLSYAYSTIDVEQSFMIIESNVQFINDVIAAGILLDEFNDMGSVKNDEVRLSIVELESYHNIKNGVVTIKNLALADFERSTNLADRFTRTEARFFARFRIAEAMLDPNAEEYEKEMQSKADERYYID